VEALIPLKEEFKMVCKFMVAMTANIGGEMKKESRSIMIFGMILYFTSKLSEKFAMRPGKTRKAFINI
jgi:hypothetical protein